MAWHCCGSRACRKRFKRADLPTPLGPVISPTAALDQGIPAVPDFVHTLVLPQGSNRGVFGKGLAFQLQVSRYISRSFRESGIGVETRFGKRGRRGLLEGLPEQAFADAIMAGVEGGQESISWAVSPDTPPWRPNKRRRRGAKLDTDHTFLCRANESRYPGCVVVPARRRARPAGRRDSAARMGPTGGRGGGWG